jgi:periodic tryptophan protein 2
MFLCETCCLVTLLVSNEFLCFVFLQKVEEALAENQQQRALLLSLRLNEDSLIKKCVFAVDPSNVRAICSSVPFKYLQRLIDAFADLLESCPHLEFILLWAQVPFLFYCCC